MNCVPCNVEFVQEYRLLLRLSLLFMIPAAARVGAVISFPRSALSYPGLPAQLKLWSSVCAIVPPAERFFLVEAITAITIVFETSSRNFSTNKSIVFRRWSGGKSLEGGLARWCSAEPAAKPDSWTYPFCWGHQWNILETSRQRHKNAIWCGRTDGMNYSIPTGS